MITRRTAEIDRAFPDMTPADAEAWQVWLFRHGLDPCRVLIGYPLVCDDIKRSITYTAPAGSYDGLLLIRESVQLEAPALDLPLSPFIITIDESGIS